MKKYLLTILVVAIFMGFYNVSYAQNPFINVYNSTLTSQLGTTGNDILDIFRSIAGYLIVLGGIIAGIAIIAAGIMYMAAGSSPTRLATAKAIFKNGVIGALILFAAGLIVNTIILLAVNWQAFFN